MKFVKRISLFFIYPMTMFCVGFASHMAIQDFFYPGIVRERDISPMRSTAGMDEVSEGVHKDNQADTTAAAAAVSTAGAGAAAKVGMKAEADTDAVGNTVQETAMNREPVLTANTSYIVVSYNTISGESIEQMENAPDGYIGYNRQELQEALLAYEKSPSLTDLEKGFEGAELLSFSSERVVVRKSYRKEEKKGFFLINENHNVVVYDKALQNVYMDTGIHMEDLPEALREEIQYMKYVETEEELFDFLESYSS